MAGLLHTCNEDTCKESSDNGKSHVVRSSLAPHEHLLFAPSVSPIVTLQIPSIPAPAAGLNSLAPAISLLYQGKPLSTRAASAGAEHPSALAAQSRIPSRKGQEVGDVLEKLADSYPLFSEVAEETSSGPVLLPPESSAFPSK